MIFLQVTDLSYFVWSLQTVSSQTKRQLYIFFTVNKWKVPKTNAHPPSLQEKLKKLHW